MPAEDPGAVDEHVDRPELLDGGEALVTAGLGRGPAAVREVGEHLLQALAVDVDAEHDRALAGEPQHRRTALARGGAGDHGTATVVAAHRAVYPPSANSDVPVT